MVRWSMRKPSLTVLTAQPTPCVMATMPSTLGKSSRTARFFDFADDERGHGGGAIHGGDDAHVVTRADFSVPAAIAHEGIAITIGEEHGRAGILGIGVIVAVCGHPQVVLVHMLAGGDLAGGLPDDLAELDHAFTSSDGIDRHLVATQDQLGWNGGAAFNRLAGIEVPASHDDVVRRVKLKGLSGWHEENRSLKRLLRMANLN